MSQSTQVQPEGAAQVAGRLLAALRSGESAGLEQELEHSRRAARRLRSALEMPSALEMERLEVLAGVLESLEQGRGQHGGAVRLLEHLAEFSLREADPSDF
jgi:hypothetical protein